MLTGDCYESKKNMFWLWKHGILAFQHTLTAAQSYQPEQQEVNRGH